MKGPSTLQDIAQDWDDCKDAPIDPMHLLCNLFDLMIDLLKGNKLVKPVPIKLRGLIDYSVCDNYAAFIA